MKSNLIIFSVHTKNNIEGGLTRKIWCASLETPLSFCRSIGLREFRVSLPFSSAVRCPALHREIPSAPEAAISSWWPQPRPRPRPPPRRTPRFLHVVEYQKSGPLLREDEEDLEVKLRRIIENVLVSGSATPPGSAGSGSGDFHQVRSESQVLTVEILISEQLERKSLGVNL